MNRTLVLALGLIPFLFAGCEFASMTGSQQLATIQVYKTPTCGCCVGWIESLEANGFQVVATDLPDLVAVKSENQVPHTLESCHTATVDGYVIEGHVPAEDVKRLLEERPKVTGLAVPGMPLGSPGMEHPDPSRHQAYQVLAFGPSGLRVFAQHGPGID